MIDVDRLKEALDNTLMDDDGVVHQSRHRGDQAAILTAARLLVAGEPLWWCETHGVSGWRASEFGVADDECWKQVWGQDDDYVTDRCRMVEGVWVPTGTTNPVLTKTDLVVPTGKDET